MIHTEKIGKVKKSIPRGKKDAQHLIPDATGILSLLLLILLLFSAHTAFPAGEEPPAEQPVSSSIPLAEIATQAIKARDSIRELKAQFASNQDFEKNIKDITAASGRVKVQEQETLKFLQTKPLLERLQAEGLLWQNNKNELNRKLNFLSVRANRLQSAQNQLVNLQKTWSQALSFARSMEAEDKLIQQISEVLEAVDAEQKNVKNLQATLMDYQREAAERVAGCVAILDQISAAQRSVISQISSSQRRPIWSKALWAGNPDGIFSRLSEITAYPMSDIETYLFAPDSPVVIHLCLFAFLFGLFLMMKKTSKEWVPIQPSPLISSVLDRPGTASLIITLLTASAPVFTTPVTVQNLFEVLAMVAVIRLMKPALDQKILFVLYALWCLFVMDMARHAFSSAVLFNQIVVMEEALIGLGVSGWLVTHRQLQPSFMKAAGLTRGDVFGTGSFVVMVLFAVGLLAGILGYLLAAHFFTSGIIVGGALALELFACIRILRSMAAFSFRIWPLRLLHIVSRHRDLLERRLYRIFIWLAVMTWVFRVLDYIGLFRPALLLFNTVLEAKLQRGSISISLGDVFAFILSMLTAYYISRFICFILNEDIYPRTKVSHGISYAMTRLLHYLIMVIGFLVGIGLLGMDLTRVTVLISAFGVGIGFGLQGVVNNFVSGLILLFEQPIHADDIVEVGSVKGVVARIGIRASILRTRQGAEVIIPNSQLITEQVTNWTYTDRRRQIDLPVGVNYSAAPRKVIETLLAAASAHQRILKYPPPQVILVGFGDSSINYELRAWTDDSADWPVFKSELAIAVYDAIQAAGMSFPFPQREVRLLQKNET